MHVELNGGSITLCDIHISMLNEMVARFDLEQFSVVRGTGEKIDTWNISTPINGSPLIKKEFAGQIHRHRAEQRKKNQHRSPNGPDGTPPKGTPPRGGAGSLKEFVQTFAIAA